MFLKCLIYLSSKAMVNVCIFRVNMGPSSKGKSRDWHLCKQMQLLSRRSDFVGRVHFSVEGLKPVADVQQLQTANIQKELVNSISMWVCNRWQNITAVTEIRLFIKSLEKIRLTPSPVGSTVQRSNTEWMIKLSRYLQNTLDLVCQRIWGSVLVNCDRKSNNQQQIFKSSFIKRIFSLMRALEQPFSCSNAFVNLEDPDCVFEIIHLGSKKNYSSKSV